jgi:tRNA threonylcarbamoyladenosine biosynthesis protein TsaB
VSSGSGSPLPAARIRADSNAPLILALDTSGPVETFALSQGDLPLAQQHSRKPRAQGTALVESIERTLQSLERKPEDLSAIAVAVGPGSFTGLRVGIAVARGLADGLGIPTLGYPSTLGWACAMQGRKVPVGVTLDARRGELYTALYCTIAAGRPQLLREVRLESPESWARALAVDAADGALLVGDGALLYRSLLCSEPGSSLRIAEPFPAGPDMSWVATDVARRIAENPVETERLEPMYLRQHDGEKTR